MAQPQVAIIDCGSAFTRVGFAGDNAPRCCFWSAVGRAGRHSVGVEQNKNYIAEDLEEKRAQLKISRPVERCKIENFQDYKELVRHGFIEELRIDPGDCCVVVGQRPGVGKSELAELCKMYFEELQVKGLNVNNNQIYSMLASGMTTGITLDIGEGMTTVVPIYDGLMLHHAVRKVNFGGKDLTQKLEQVLETDPLVGSQLSKDTQILRDIKQKMCYAQYNGMDKVEERIYELPDGYKASVKQLNIKQPYDIVESLFSNTDSVQSLVTNAANAIDEDIRPELQQNIVLSGGSTLFRGFEERLNQELNSHDSEYVINALEDRENATFTGMSIVGGLDTFKMTCVSAAEFAEVGENVVWKKQL